MRDIPVPPALVDFINKKAVENGIDLFELTKQVNKNNDLVHDEYIRENFSKLPQNHWFVNNGKADALSIIVNLDYALVSDIMFKKTSSCKYYILQSMLYTLFRLEGTDESTASQLAINTLNEYKFLSMEERNKIKKK